MGKLELPPFDAPEAETEIVAGALTEYGGRGLAIFNLGKAVEMIVGMALIATLYLGGAPNLPVFLLKTLTLVLVLALLQSLLTRLRIDQVVRWWRYFALLALGQIIVLVVYLLLVTQGVL
jgi:NADH-quinone oxidoreductase subunit H